jgi:Pyruvate/2-oxoacid:ferredoxin oxidoreductase gamma subunit
MAKVHEITIWTRGVTMDKEGRDIATAIGDAFDKEGKHVQFFDNYEDLPDRVLVTTRKYVRVSDEEIAHKYVYTNDHPEVVIIAEPTIIKGIDILEGMEKGGTLIINSHRDIDYLLKFIPNKDLLSTVATVDADAISGIKTVDFSGSEGGVDSAGVGAGMAAAMAGAFAKVTGMVKKETLAGIVKDVAGMEKGYADVKVKKLN